MPRVSHLRDPQMRRPGFYPPPATRFVEYGPEDADWMLPLGLGTEVYFDLRVRNDFDFGPLYQPHSFLLTTF
jgi:hypothetical protein